MLSLFLRVPADAGCPEDGLEDVPGGEDTVLGGPRDRPPGHQDHADLAPLRLAVDLRRVDDLERVGAAAGACAWGARRSMSGPLGSSGRGRG